MSLILRRKLFAPPPKPEQPTTADGREFGIMIVGLFGDIRHHGRFHARLGGDGTNPMLLRLAGGQYRKADGGITSMIRSMGDSTPVHAHDTTDLTDHAYDAWVHGRLQGALATRRRMSEQDYAGRYLHVRFEDITEGGEFLTSAHGRVQRFTRQGVSGCQVRMNSGISENVHMYLSPEHPVQAVGRYDLNDDARSRFRFYGT